MYPLALFTIVLVEVPVTVRVVLFAVLTIFVVNKVWREKKSPKPEDEVG